MLAVWKTGEANIKPLWKTWTDPPPYTTVASTIKNLEKKGYLSSRPVVILTCISLQSMSKTIKRNSWVAWSKNILIIPIKSW